MRMGEDPAYLRHRGKPLVAVWGIGFNDDRTYSLAECRALVKFLKANRAVLFTRGDKPVRGGEAFQPRPDNALSDAFPPPEPHPAPLPPPVLPPILPPGPRARGLNTGV